MTLKTFSVVIRWSDNYDDMGDFGEIVKARDHEHAKRIVRARMVRQVWSERDEGETKSESLDLYRRSDGRLFGECLECYPGAIWKAADLEKALREIASYGDMPPGAELDGTSALQMIEIARAAVAEIDAI